MKRMVTCLILSIGILAPPSVLADGSLKKAMSTIPSDALGFVMVPNFKQLDADYQKAVVNLGLQPLVPPPMQSLVAALKMQAPMLAKLNDDGPIAIVFMPADSVPELQMKQVVIVSAKDPKAFIEGMNGQPGEDGLWNVNMFGMPSYAVALDDRVAITMTPDTAKAVKNSKKGIHEHIDAQIQSAMEGLDVILWVDGKRLMKPVRPMVEGMVLPMMMAQAGQGGFEAKSAEMNKKSIEMLMDGIGSFAFGVALDDTGLGLRVLLTAEPQSELAKRTKLKTTGESLLSGLPDSDFLFAMGQTVDPEAVEASEGDFDNWIGMGSEIEGIDKEKVKKLGDAVKDLFHGLRGMRGSVDLLSPDGNGLFGLSLVLETTGSEAWVGMTSDIWELSKGLIKSAAEAKAGDDADEVKEVLDAIDYHKEAETIAGAKVSQFTLDLDKIAKMEEADEDDIEMVKKVFGKEGFMFRLASVDGKNVAISFGGGEKRMGQLIESAKSGASPLESRAGIRKSNQYLPQKRASVAFFAIDRIIQAIKTVQETVDEEVLPLQFPPINAPVAIGATGGDSWVRYDIVFPMELLVAGKNAAMSMMGGPPPDGAGPQ